MSKRTCCTDFHLYGACKHTAEATARLSGSITRFMRNNAEDIRLHTQAIINPAPTQRQELQQQTPQNLALHGTLTHEECATILHGLRLIQCEGRIEGCAAGDCEHFEDTPALTNDQIDALAERINFDAVSTNHPQTDEHLAACASCMMAHDKALPDAVLSKTCTPADTRPTLTAEEWADVAIALQTKMDSPSAAGDDHLTRTWRSHLATLIEEVNAHKYDFNADDWVEIYYAVVDSDANQNIAAKIGPHGTNMRSEPQPLNTEDAIAAAIDRDKAKGIDWQGVGVIDTRKRTDSIGVHLDPHNWQQTR